MSKEDLNKIIHAQSQRIKQLEDENFQQHRLIIKLRGDRDANN